MSDPLTEKIAIASRLAVTMAGRELDLADELADIGMPELERDPDYVSLLRERIWCCEDCGVWNDAAYDNWRGEA